MWRAIIGSAFLRYASNDRNFPLRCFEFFFVLASLILVPIAIHSVQRQGQTSQVGLVKSMSMIPLSSQIIPHTIALLYTSILDAFTLS